MDVNELLQTAHSQGASDLHIKVGSSPILRINGELHPLPEEKRLSQQFGSIYDEYRRSTPFMIPFVNTGLPVPESRWRRIAALTGYYVAGMAILCLIMLAIGVEIAWYG